MKRIEKMLEVVAIILMILMTGTVSIQIISRVSNHPLIWTEELSRYILVYITFLGSTLAYYKGEELRITMLIDRFPPSVRKVNDFIIWVLKLVLVFMMIYVGLKFTSKIWDTTTTALNWNKGLIMVVIPIGFSLILIRQIKDIKKFILKIEARN